jgi:hypothetical protein
MKNFISIKKNLFIKNEFLKKLTKNNNLNLKIPNELKPETNLFLNYLTIKNKNNIIKKE